MLPNQEEEERWGCQGNLAQVWVQEVRLPSRGIYSPWEGREQGFESPVVCPRQDLALFKDKAQESVMQKTRARRQTNTQPNKIAHSSCPRANPIPARQCNVSYQDGAVSTSLSPQTL